MTARHRLAAVAAALAGIVTVLVAPTAASASPASYIAGAVPDAQVVQQEYGIPASVTIAQSANESGWGESRLSVNDNNYFGIKCASSGSPGPIATGCHAYPTTECTPTCHTVTAYFRVYRSRRDSFRDYGELLTNNDRYARAFRYTDDPDQFIREIAAAGYATDPNYADTIIRIMRTYNLYQYNVARCSGPATIYGVVGDSTLTVTRLADPVGGGARTFGAKTIATLPFTVKTIAALDFNTLFATNGNNLYKIEVINFNNTSTSVTTSLVDQGGWTQDHLAYDGYGHLFGTAAGNLRRYNLSSSYGIVSNTLIGDGGWYLSTFAGAANQWAIATAGSGELISYHLNPIKRYSLRPNTWTFRNLVSPGGGVYYAQHRDGALSRYVDADPTDGSGADISAGKTIDASGWTQRLLTAQPRVCS